ncbi:class I SAM-dependent methyltransferase [Rubritalea spongiae]|uniref:Class I SAM-dependent methyltransferase n=1 Tax=Rubritalea spongiae TaxID=430797 RepID=A0ABW5E302_9BACT
MAGIDYSRVAKLYCAIERIVFARKLENVRLWCLNNLHLVEDSKVLIVGGGDGRFLRELIGRYGRIRVDYVEPSASMVAVAQSRVEADSRVSWHQSRIEDWGGGEYDLVVAHFVLDTFEPSVRPRVADLLIQKVKPGASVVVSDFCYEGGKRERVMMWLMQCFFCVIAGQPMWEVSRDDTAFTKKGAEISCEQSWSKGWIYSQIWKI